MIDNPDAVLRSMICAEPLYIFESEVPTGVLSGVVVTDWFCWLSFWIGDCPRIICETERLARRVRLCLEAEGCEPRPEIRFREVRHAA